MLLEGIFIPVMTPFYPDGRLYARKLEHNIARYAKTQAAGLLVLGEAAEADALTDDETREVLSTAIQTVSQEKVMLAAVGRQSVFATLLLADAAAHLDYDAVVIEAPAFVKDSTMRLELMTYFQAVADRSPLPVVFASTKQLALPDEAITELAAHPQVLGVMEGDVTATRLAAIRARTASIRRDVQVTSVFAAVTGRMQRHVGVPGAGNFVSAESLSVGLALAAAPPAPALKVRTKKVDFQILCSATATMLDAWQAGAVGAIPRLGACAPQACCEVYQAFRDQDQPLALEKQERLRAAGERMESLAGIAAMKHACDLNGYFGGRPRLPLLTLRADEKRAVDNMLAGLQN